MRNPCGGHAEESLQGRSRTSAERAIVRVHISDPVAVAVDSRVLSVFLAMRDTLQIHSIIDSDSLSTSCIIKLH